jgi:hypothetical protein
MKVGVPAYFFDVGRCEFRESDPDGIRIIRIRFPLGILFLGLERLAPRRRLTARFDLRKYLLKDEYRL